MISRQGLWGTHPPKCLSDVVEALLGVAHVDGGFHQGQKSASLVVKPLMETILANVPKDTSENKFFLKKQSNMITQPKQVLYEFLPHQVQVKTYKFTDFFMKENENQNIPVWSGDSWNKTALFIGEVKWCGMTICCVADNYSSVARNRSCALFTSIVGRCDELIDRLKEMSDKLERVEGNSSEKMETMSL